MGFLNPTPDDDAHIQAMAEGGTTELPGASGFDGLMTAVQKGAVGGLDKVAQMSEAVGASDTGSYLYSALTHIPQSTIQQLSTDAQDTERSNANVKAIQQWAATGQDPRVTGGLGRIVNTTAEGLTIAGLGTAAGGPMGAAALLTGSEGHAKYLQNKAAGLDDDTALEDATVTALAAGASAFLPMKFGSTAVQSVAGGVASNVAIGAATRAATSGILYANGYKAQAAQERPFDASAMLADTIMGAAFGALGHYTHGAEAPAKPEVNPADVDAAAAVLTEDHFNRSAPGIPTAPDVATLHADTMQHAIDALTRGDQPTITEPAARTLLEGSIPDPAQDMAPHILAAAREDIPQFADAVAPVKEVAPPVREEGPALGLHLDAQGQPSATQFDRGTHYQLDRLVRQYPDLTITRDDGSSATVREIAQEMQQQMDDAHKLADAHEVAAACFIATGGAT